MMSFLRTAALSVVLGGAVAVPWAIGVTATTPATDPAAKQIETFHVGLLDTMKHAKELGVRGRYKKLEPAVDAAFDFGAMTQLIVGPSWSAMSPADRQSVTDAFRRMTIANYAKNFDGYGGEQFITNPQVQERNGDKIVSTQMTAPGKAPISFIYRLDNKQGSWKIADIFLNGYVSEVATRRADFASTLTSGGAPALVQKLNSLSDNMLH